MQTWFTCKINYYKPIEGTDKKAKVAAYFLVNAWTFTEAEARIYSKCEEMIFGEFFVDKITKNQYAEVIENDDSDDWYKIKISYLIEDERTGKERQSSSHSLMQASSVKDAYAKMEKILTSSADRYVIPAISITKIEEVFRFASSDPNELKHGLPQEDSSHREFAAIAHQEDLPEKQESPSVYEIEVDEEIESDELDQQEAIENMEEN